jgi:hypothetical protein
MWIDRRASRCQTGAARIRRIGHHPGAGTDFRPLALPAVKSSSTQLDFPQRLYQLYDPHVHPGLCTSAACACGYDRNDNPAHRQPGYPIHDGRALAAMAAVIWALILRAIWRSRWLEPFSIRLLSASIDKNINDRPKFTFNDVST